ncbi:hypothetical protein GCM10023331_21700 [Algivirga pacifica]|uniref:HYR domain-containing protein n=2 Tax=Algivirga pacifica TaxID=1162670 RepID=A0ABP9DDV5_9BACT
MGMLFLSSFIFGRTAEDRYRTNAPELTAEDVACALTLSTAYNTSTNPYTYISCTVPDIIALRGTAFTVTESGCTVGEVTFEQTPTAGTVSTTDENGVIKITIESFIGGVSDQTLDVYVKVTNLNPPTISFLNGTDTTLDLPTATDCEMALPDLTSMISYNDDCGIVSISQSPAAGTIVPFSSYLDAITRDTLSVTFTVKDTHGLSTTETAKVIIDPGFPFNITHPDTIFLPMDENCEVRNIKADSIFNTFFQVEGSCDVRGPFGSTTPDADVVGSTGYEMTFYRYDYNVPDGDRFLAQFNALLTPYQVILYPIDTSAVTITTSPTDTTFYTPDGTCELAVPDLTGSITYEDCEVVTLTQVNPVGDLLQLGSNIVKVYAEDASGNKDSCSIEVFLEDKILPTVTAVSATLALNTVEDCQGRLPADLSALFTYSDNCTDAAGLTLTFSHAAEALVSDAETLELIVTDASGNQNTSSITIEVTDNVLPVITAPEVFDLPLNALCNGVLTSLSADITATDNCTAEADLNITQLPTVGSLVEEGDTVKVYVEDEAGNKDSVSIVINIIDTEAPEIDFPSDTVVVDLGSACQGLMPDLSADFLVYDNCGVVDSAYQTIDTDSLLTLGTHQVPIRAVDSDGNVTVRELVLVLKESTAPSIFTLTDTTVYVSAGTCESVMPDVLSLVKAIDNCTSAGSISLVQSVAVGEVLALGTHEVTVIATDDFGNEDSTKVQVIVADQEAPVLTLSATEYSLTASSSTCTASVPDLLSLVTVTDNCDASASVTQSIATGTLLGVGDHTLTFTATDASGNSATASITLKVEDTTAPEFVSTLEDKVYDADASTCSLSLPDYTTGLDVRDACSAVTITQSPSAGSANLTPGDSVEVTLTATDVALNSDSRTFWVVYRDTLSPVFTQSAADTVLSTTTGTCTAMMPDLLPLLESTDNCGGMLTYSQSIASGSTLAIGTHTVTLTARDDFDNETTQTISVTVSDQEAPALTLSATEYSLTASSSTCTASVPDLLSLVTVTDNCDASASVTQSIATGTLLGVGDHTLTFTATDASGNSAIASITLKVEDTTAPEFVSTLEDKVYDADASTCGLSLPDYTAGLDVRDACSAVTITQSPSAGSTTLTPGDSVEVTLTATDVALNSDSRTFWVVYRDTLSPVFTQSAADTVLSTTTGTCTAMMPDLLPLLEATDNCGGMLTYSQSIASGSTLAIGTHTVTLAATDDFDNATTQTITVTVSDQEAPALTLSATKYSLTASASSCTASVPDLLSLATVTDNCDASASVTQSITTGTLLGLGDHTLTFTAIDASGNSATASITLKVEDTTVPEFVSTLEDKVYDADASTCSLSLPDYTTGLDVRDACSAVTITQSPLAGSTTLTPGDSVEVTLTATDVALNSDSRTFWVVYRDTLSPVFTQSAADTVLSTTTGTCTAMMPDLLPLLEATDNCGGMLTYSQSIASGSTLAIGTHTVTLAAKDDFDNETTQTITVTVADQEAPAFTLSATEYSLTASSSTCTTSVPDLLSLVTVTDNCDTSASVTQSIATGTLLGVGDHTLTFTATDASGNRATASITLKVEDTTAPEFVTMLEDKVYDADASTCSLSLPDYTTDLDVRDACSAVTITQSPLAGSTTLTPGDSVEVTLTATDVALNSDSRTFWVVYRDTLSPVFTQSAADTVLSTTTGTCTAMMPDLLPLLEATDNCGGTVTYSQSIASGSTLAIGTHTVTLTARDDFDNETTQTISVTVADQEAPALTLSATAYSLTASSSTCTTSVPDLLSLVTVTDNCDASANVTQSIATGTLLGVGDHTLTFTATDASGNSATASITLKVEDTTAPEFVSTLEDKIYDADASTCGLSLPDYTTGLDIRDACSAVTITQSPSAGSTTLTPGDSVEVTLTATDVALNSDSRTFWVVYRDTLSPVFTQSAADTVLSTTTGTCTTMMPDLLPLLDATDNCGGTVTYSQSIASGSTLAIGTHTVTLTARDDFDNETTQTITVTVADQEAPELTLSLDTLLINSSANCLGEVPDLSSYVTYTDNCTANPTLSQSMPVGVSLIAGVYPVTISVTDEAGNKAEEVLYLKIEDQTPPQWIYIPVADTLSSTTCEVTLPDYTDQAIARDFCGTVTLSQSPVTGTVLLAGDSVEVSITASDEALNTTTESFWVYAKDRISPTMVTKPITLLIADASCSITMPSLVDSFTVADNCTPLNELQWEQSISKGETLLLGEYIVDVSATDLAGNTISKKVPVTVKKQSPLSVQVNVDQLLLEMGADNCSAVLPSDLTAYFTVQNACESYSYTISPREGTLIQDSTWLKINVYSGVEQSEDSILVRVEDTQTPVLTLTQDSIQLVKGDNCYAQVPDLSDYVKVFENCGTYSLTQSVAEGTAFVDSVSVYLIVEDEAGNKAQTSIFLNAIEVTPPMLQYEDTLTLYLTKGCVRSLPDLRTHITATDNCTLANDLLWVQSMATGTALTIGEYPITVEVSDYSGNRTKGTVVVKVVDQIPPVLQAPTAYQRVLPDFSERISLEELRDKVTATDNCSLQEITFSPSLSNLYAVGNYEITAIAKDFSGNSAEVKIQVEVTDGNTSPVAREASFQLREDHTLEDSLTAWATDAEKDVLGFTLAQMPEHGEVILSLNGHFTYTPFADFNGEDRFSYIVQELNRGDGALTDTSWVLLSVLAQEDDPMLEDISVDLDVGESEVEICLDQVDADGDFLVIEELINEADHGTVTVDQEEVCITYRPEDTFYGRDSIQLLVCEEEKGKCDTVNIQVQVSLALEEGQLLNVYNALSPNQDGQNDRWIIQGIERYPDNVVKVYNTQGMLLYEEKGYNNHDKCWHGTYKREVVQGTYIYVIEFTAENGQPVNLRGFLEVRL